MVTVRQRSTPFLRSMEIETPLFTGIDPHIWFKRPFLWNTPSRLMVDTSSKPFSTSLILTSNCSTMSLFPIFSDPSSNSIGILLDHSTLLESYSHFKHPPYFYPPWDLKVPRYHSLYGTSKGDAREARARKIVKKHHAIVDTLTHANFNFPVQQYFILRCVPFHSLTLESVSHQQFYNIVHPSSSSSSSSSSFSGADFQSLSLSNSKIQTEHDIIEKSHCADTLEQHDLPNLSKRLKFFEERIQCTPTVAKLRNKNKKRQQHKDVSTPRRWSRFDYSSE